MRLKFLILNLLIVLTLSASTASDAEKAYRAEQWDKAEVLYAKLLKGSPTNRIYNHRYGVSLYEQRKDLAKAEKHLLIAKKRGINLSLYYLGRVCFLQYKFDEATAYYEAFLSSSNDRELKALTRQYLPKSEQGKQLISRTEDVKILDKVEVDKKDFFLHYKVSKEAGSFLKDAASIDEDVIADNSTIYLTERGDRAFFAVPEKEGNTNLYSKNKLLDHWSEKTPLGDAINSDNDEAFPFLMSDGVVLYFSSKGHNSFGGYDIYVTRYNANNNTYLPPQQLGMPFNSPGNDILFAIDEYNNVGWFASDRDSEAGKIAIYTFVPNDYVKLLNTNDQKALIKAAKAEVSTSKDTSSVLMTSEKPIIAHKPKPAPHAIYFVLNDTLIYTQQSDFMSQDARAMYMTYESTVASYDSVSQAVTDLRKTYSSTTDSNEKAAMIANIMKLEEQSYKLEEKRDNSLRTTRRLELETILANGGYTKERPQTAKAPKTRTEVEEEHVSAWQTPVPVVTKEKVTKPFFYNQTLYGYYDQIYSQTAVEKLIKAHQMKTNAGDKQFLADYVMREYKQPEPEETFFQKIFAYDTTLTPKLTQSEIVAKVQEISKAGAQLFVEANYLSYYTLKGQNVILLESVKNEKYRSELKGLMDRADFSLQTANQKIYVSEGVYTRNKQNMAAGNNDLKEGIQLQEAASLTYLKYRYEAQKKPQATKPVPEEKDEAPIAHKEMANDSSTVALPTVSKRTAIPEKTLNTKEKTAPKEEYRIQFGIFSRLLKEGDVKLKDLSYAQIENKQLYKYFSGHYATQMDAAMGLEEAKAKGFKDAYVVKFVDGLIQ